MKRNRYFTIHPLEANSGNVFQYGDIIQKFKSGHIFIGSEFLGEITDQSLQFLAFLHKIHFVYPDGTHTPVEHTANNAHECCLTGSIGAKKTEHTALYFQRNAV